MGLEYKSTFPFSWWSKCTSFAVISITNSRAENMPRIFDDEVLTELKQAIMPMIYTESLDIHPTEPWILKSTSPGQVSICDLLKRPFKTFHLHMSASLESKSKLENERVRCGKFVARNKWIIVGTDSSCIYCYDYTTMRQVHATDTKSGPIQNLLIHPTLSFCLSCSETERDIRAWSWDQHSWKDDGVFAGHTGSVEQIMWHPENPNVFWSASLDKTVKIWDLSSRAPKKTLSGHRFGATCLDYFTHQGKVHIVSGGNDKGVKIWDCESGNYSARLQVRSIVSVKALRKKPLIVVISDKPFITIWDASSFWDVAKVDCSSERLYLSKLNKKFIVSYPRDQTALEEIECSCEGVDVECGREDSFICGSPGKTDRLCCKLLHVKRHWSIFRFVSSEGKMFFAEYRDGDHENLTCKLHTSSDGRSEPGVWIDAFETDDCETVCQYPPYSRVWIPQYRSSEWRTWRLGYCAQFVFGGRYLGVGTCENVHYYDWETGKTARICPFSCVKFQLGGRILQKLHHSAEQESFSLATNTPPTVCCQCAVDPVPSWRLFHSIWNDEWPE